MLAGHGGDAVTWLSDRSTAGRRRRPTAAAPCPAVQCVRRGQPDRRRLRQGLDAAPAARPLSRIRMPSRAKPRPAAGRQSSRTCSGERPATARPDRRSTRSGSAARMPIVYLGRMAAALVESMQLGSATRHDVLAVSFSSPDLVGHAFGPRSQEVQDMLRAPRSARFGTLLDRLDTLVGPDQYVVGSQRGPRRRRDPRAAARKADGTAGRLDTRRAWPTWSRPAQRASLGPGATSTASAATTSTSSRACTTKLTTLPGAIDASSERSSAARHRARLPCARSLRGTTSERSAARAAALSYVQGRSGDLILALEARLDVHRHRHDPRQRQPDDQRVPVILFGHGVKPGAISRAGDAGRHRARRWRRWPASRMPQAEGRVLRAALRSR